MCDFTKLFIENYDVIVSALDLNCDKSNTKVIQTLNSVTAFGIAIAAYLNFYRAAVIIPVYDLPSVFDYLVNDLGYLSSNLGIGVIVVPESKSDNIKYKWFLDNLPEYVEVLK